MINSVFSDIADDEHFNPTELLPSNDIKWMQMQGGRPDHQSHHVIGDANLEDILLREFQAMSMEALHEVEKKELENINNRDQSPHSKISMDPPFYSHESSHGHYNSNHRPEKEGSMSKQGEPDMEIPNNKDIYLQPEGVPNTRPCGSRAEVTSVPMEDDDWSHLFDSDFTDSDHHSDFDDDETEEERLKRLIDKWSNGIDDLKKDKSKLLTAVEELKREKATLEYQLLSPEGETEVMDQFVTNYPSEEVTIKNLVRAQLEYYLSYVNLKQDKRTLNELLAWPSGYLRISSVMKLTRIRQLSINEDLLKEGLAESRVLDLREFEGKFPENDAISATTVSNESKSSSTDHKSTVLPPPPATSSITKPAKSASPPGCDVSSEEDVKSSEDIISKSERITTEWCVGRLNFVPPAERKFPFRRTVFIYGIPSFDGDKDQSIEFVKEMLAPFGALAGEPKLDCEECDFRIGAQLLKKARVFEFFATDVPICESQSEKPPVYEFFTDLKTLKNRYLNEHCPPESSACDYLWKYFVDEDKEEFNCLAQDCKQKPIKDGVYCCLSDRTQPMLCPQCGARRAEENQIAQWHELSTKQRNPRLREKYLGRNPHFDSKTKGVRTCTARAVFTSQRQAAKCAFIRTRVAWNGAFATQLHHYAKVKKSVNAASLSSSDTSTPTADPCESPLVKAVSPPGKKDSPASSVGSARQGSGGQRRNQGRNKNRNHGGSRGRGGSRGGGGGSSRSRRGRYSSRSQKSAEPAMYSGYSGHSAQSYHQHPQQYSYYPDNQHQYSYHSSDWGYGMSSASQSGGFYGTADAAAACMDATYYHSAYHHHSGSHHHHYHQTTDMASVPYHVSSSSSSTYDRRRPTDRWKK